MYERSIKAPLPERAPTKVPYPNANLTSTPPPLIPGRPSSKIGSAPPPLPMPPAAALSAAAAAMPRPAQPDPWRELERKLARAAGAGGGAGAAKDGAAAGTGPCEHETPVEDEGGVGVSDAASPEPVAPLAGGGSDPGAVDLVPVGSKRPAEGPL